MVTKIVLQLRLSRFNCYVPVLRFLKSSLDFLKAKCENCGFQLEDSLSSIQISTCIASPKDADELQRSRYVKLSLRLFRGFHISCSYQKGCTFRHFMPRTLLLQLFWNPTQGDVFLEENYLLRFPK